MEVRLIGDKMKQHITDKQWLELSEDGKRKLMDWDESNGYQQNDSNMSIGQMIEFLVEKRKTLFFLTQLDCHGGKQWSTGSMTCRGNHHSGQTQEF